MRVILYIAEDKIEWYNQNDLHALVLDALYPVVINNLIVDGGADLNKKTKDDRDHRVIQSMSLFFIISNVLLNLIDSGRISYIVSIYPAHCAADIN